jgi:integrase
VGTRARLAMALLLYTAQRRADVVRMGWQHVAAGRIAVRQGKTGERLQIPIHPALQRVLDATPRENLTFLMTDYGQPFTPAGFGNWFGERCREAGLRAGLQRPRAAQGGRQAARGSRLHRQANPGRDGPQDAL